MTDADLSSTLKAAEVDCLAAIATAEAAFAADIERLSREADALPRPTPPKVTVPGPAAGVDMAAIRDLPGLIRSSILLRSLPRVVEEGHDPARVRREEIANEIRAAHKRRDEAVQDARNAWDEASRAASDAWYAANCA